jgi:hypothetical protein
MKTAICISGHLRHYKNLKDNFLSFKNTLKKFSDVDVFVSTWDKQNTLNSWSHAHHVSNAETVKNIVNINEVKENYETDNVELFNYDFYSSEHSPISYKDLTDKIYNWDSRGIGGNVINSSKMFFLIYQANKQKKYKEFLNQKKYDLVFRVRPDYEFANYENFFKSVVIEDNAIYCPLPYPSSQIDDQFSFGNSQAMDKYSSCWNKQAAIFHSNVWGDPENVLKHSLFCMHEIKLIHIPRLGFLGSDVSSSKR